jgi:hypothetical protein
MSAFVTACIPEEDCEAERQFALRIVMRSNPQDAAQLLECMADVDLAPRLSEIRVPTLLRQYRGIAAGAVRRRGPCAFDHASGKGRSGDRTVFRVRLTL